MLLTFKAASLSSLFCLPLFSRKQLTTDKNEPFSQNVNYSNRFWRDDIGPRISPFPAEDVHMYLCIYALRYSAIVRLTSIQMLSTTMGHCRNYLHKLYLSQLNRVPKRLYVLLFDINKNCIILFSASRTFFLFKVSQATGLNVR